MYQTDMHKSSESCSTKYSACVWVEKAQPPLELNFRHLDIFVMLLKNAFGQKNSNFMHRFKSAILTIFQFFQNGNFEPMLGI